MAAASTHNTAAAQSPSPSEKLKLNDANGAPGASDTIDHPHYKDLQRSLRNAMKKLNATVKVDSIIAENPGKSLEALVAEKKINTDQKAQAEKKPALQASIVQFQEQISHFKDFAAHYEERLAGEKANLENALKGELESLREKVAAAEAEALKVEEPEPKPEPEPEPKPEPDFSQQLLSLSKFLCAAATMRRAGDESSNETRAFEGVLYQVYGGSLDAVASMQKLIDGVDEKIVSVEGETLEITYAKVKQISEEQTSASEEVATEATPTTNPTTDPTTANVAYTELQDPTYTATSTNEYTPPAGEPELIAPPPQTIVTDAANAVAEAKWEPNGPSSLASSQNTESWVEVPRDPAETETGLQATPAGDSDLKNDIPASTIEGTGVKVQGGDGFEQVVHHQRQGSFRGRGRGGRGRGGDGFRGRGRGDFRGRGRGRGGRGRGGPNGAPAAAPPAAQ